MKRKFFLKILGLAALYLAIFVLLAFVQFDDHSRFSKNIGALRISGNIDRQKTGRMQTAGSQIYAVKDGIRMVFSGIEFNLSGEIDNGLAYYIGTEGAKTAAYLETMTVSMNEARFHLSYGQEISFYTDTENKGTALVISALLTNDVEHILIPFKPVYKADVRRNKQGVLTVDYNGAEYIFETNEALTIDENNGLILLSRNDPVVFYRALPSGGEFNFAGFIVSGGMEKALYNDIAQNWLDAAFSGWEQSINAGDADEDTLTAYLAEAARRGILARAVSTVSPPSGGNTARTFLSAPFLGGLNTHLREFAVSERGKISLIASYAGAGLSAYLTDEKIFDYLAHRGDTELFARGIEYIGTLNSAEVSLDMCAGIFEGWLSWNERRGNDNNPFDHLVTRAFALISAHIKKDGQNTSVFVKDETIDVLYNIRLGAALAAYGEAVMNNGWAAVGRSLVISALSIADEDGSISGHIELSGGDFTEVPETDRLDAAQIYRELGLSEFYPHAIGFETTIGRLWAWTASPDIDASFRNNTLDIYAGFPLGETHYMYIFNVPPFSRIQMRNMNYRSDSRFEQYNAPGWLYSSANRVLMLKMVQQTPSELIRITF
jgi:hypothetical protein